MSSGETTVTLASLPIAETAVVLSGGLSHERDVSLRSGRRVAMALRSRGVEVVESDVDSNLIGLLDSLPNAVVFPVLHGEAGEDGALREVLSLLGVPCVGSVGAACRMGSAGPSSTKKSSSPRRSTSAPKTLPERSRVRYRLPPS